MKKENPIGQNILVYDSPTPQVTFLATFEFHALKEIMPTQYMRLLIKMCSWLGYSHVLPTSFFSISSSLHNVSKEFQEQA